MNEVRSFLTGGFLVNSTISSSYGFILLEKDVFDLHGQLSSIAFLIDSRIWSSSSTISVPTGVFTIADNGGIDVMVPIGEPSGGAHTYGSQRPAL